jgi:2-polyprenyl-6-hydroxyphenyl methylase/3-demethylubiquinone-9 3-methyltransferase
MTVATLALLLELHLRRKDVDRRAPVDASLYLIDNEFYSHVDWWSADSTMRALRAMTPTRADYFAAALRRVSIAPRPTILDVGCGAGFVALAMAERNFTVIGVDPSANALQQARDETATRSLAVPAPTFVTGSADLLRFESGTVDAIIMADVLEHIGDLPAALREVARVLKVGGVFLFDTINRTRWSWLVTIFALQHLGVGGLCPPNTHDWSLYIRPDELTHLLDANALELRELRGLQFSLSPRLIWMVLSGANIEPDQFEVGSDISANYIGYAVKK